MNIETSAKEHIETLQRHIKANIEADVRGKVNRPPFQRMS